MMMRWMNFFRFRERVNESQVEGCQNPASVQHVPTEEVGENDELVKAPRLSNNVERENSSQPGNDYSEDKVEQFDQPQP